MIEARNITKIYGKKQNKFKALDDVSFKIPDGASVAIVGKSGSGKSTLMHALSGLDAPESGKVLIDGIDILSMKQKKIDEFRSNEMSFIFQSFFVQGNETCAENVSLPLEISEIPNKDRAKLVKRSLSLVDLSNKEKSKAKELSGGQKQRLAIARAIVNDPKILFADEPTGNLDSATSKLVEDTLFSYNKSKGVTLIIVTHDEELAEKCDMQIYIKDGKINKIVGGKNA